MVVFFGKDSRFSNHYKSVFIVNEPCYSTVEQYLAKHRALYANQPDLVERTMESGDPIQAKKVLNLLRGAEGQTDWERDRRDSFLKVFWLSSHKIKISEPTDPNHS